MSVRISSLSFTVLIGLVVFGASNAQAEVRPSDVTLPTNEAGLGPGYGKRGIQFQLDLHSFFGSREEGVSKINELGVLPRLQIIQPVGRNEFEFSMSAAHYSVTTKTGGDETKQGTFRLSNPAFTHFFTWRTLARQLRLGLGMTLPLARLRTDKPEQQATDLAALNAAAGIYGMRDRWLWRLDSMAAILHFDYLFRHRSGFMFGTRMVAAPSVRVGDSLNNTDADGQAVADQDDFGVIGQAELELAFDTKPVRIAVRAGYSIDALSDLSRDEKDQIMVEPEFRIRLGEVDLLLGMNLNIEKPAGFSFKDGNYWGARIGFATPTRLMLPQ